MIELQRFGTNTHAPNLIIAKLIIRCFGSGDMSPDPRCSEPLAICDNLRIYYVSHGIDHLIGSIRSLDIVIS